MTPTTTPTPALDFAQIREQYPAAHTEFLDWLNVGNGSQGLVWQMASNDTLTLWHPRDLYDFFDQSGVWVSVRTCGLSVPPMWAYEIDCEGGGPYRGHIPTRADAEAAAFGAAFVKLEQLLSEKQNGDA